MDKNLFNWFANWWMNNYGGISFGETSPDQVRAAVYIQNKQDARHRLFMDIDDPRKGKTSVEAPGGINIKCGQDRERPDITFLIQVENGKLSLSCQAGDVEILGKNVTVEANGEGQEGIITLKASQKIQLEAPNVSITGDQKTEINSAQLVNIKSQGKMQMYGLHGDCQSASSKYGKKGTTQNPQIGGSSE